jgi:hypothetical protein
VAPPLAASGAAIHLTPVTPANAPKPSHLPPRPNRL